jgi:hypothetical protein
MTKSEAGKLGYEKSKHKLVAAKLERQSKYDVHPVLCKYCKHKLSYKNRRNIFCNSTCSAKFSNPLRRIEHYCTCGLPREINNKYCNVCIKARVYCKKAETMTIEEAACDGTRRKILIKIRGYQCEHCGLSEWMNKPIPLELHHIDGNTNNNTSTNLELVCRNCHGLTTNHKKSNKNGTRQINRRKRYAEGKTW